MSNQSIEFIKPASNWFEELPLGNGRIGAMLSGEITSLKVRFNQDSVWSSGKKDRINKDALKTLPFVRKAIFDGRLEEAEKLIFEGMLNDPNRLGHYEPLGDLIVDYETRIPHYSDKFNKPKIEYNDYQRTLLLDKALYECSYQYECINYQREAFLSYPDQVFVMKLHTSKEKDLRIYLNREAGFSYIASSKEEEGYGLLRLGGGKNDSPQYEMMANILSDGTITSVGNYICVSGSTEILILLTSTTTFYEKNPNKWCSDTLAAARTKSYNELKENHIKDYQELYDRVELSIGDENIERYFNFSRYLMISGSRPGSLPLNLQGIWNKDINPLWGSRYTTNINLQMNYWPALAWNLPECNEVLLDFILRMLPEAKKVAKEMYGCRGAVCHHNTDIYGDSAPNETWMPGSLWPMGYAWLCTHIIKHYHFYPSKEFVEKYFKPVEEASLFFLDYLVLSKEGTLVTCPSVSPENTYILENGQKSSVCYGPTMDIHIIKELWNGYLELAEVLGHPSFDIEEEIKNKMALLPKDKIGSKGQLLEWQEEYLEWEKGHRHISHLFGLYPGTTLDNEDPITVDACKKTIEERLKYGGGQTGWSNAWLINLYARLKDGDKALEVIKKMLEEQTAPNLFDLHPPLTPSMPCVFQIDGNFGAASGIMEMLCSTRNEKNIVLPALPKEWKSGYIRGIRTKDGKTIDIKW